MAQLSSNELKAVVVQDNFLENPLSVLKENCQTVQHFDYRCEHKCTDDGQVYGVLEPVILQFSIRVNSPLHTRPYFRAMASNLLSRYSLIFNATFGATRRLTDYEDGMVVEGFIVHIEEKSAGKDASGKEDQQTLLSMTIQVHSIIYVGRDRNFKCTFIQ